MNRSYNTQLFCVAPKGRVRGRAPRKKVENVPLARQPENLVEYVPMSVLAGWGRFEARDVLRLK